MARMSRKVGPKRKVWHYHGKNRHRVASVQTRKPTPRPPRGPAGEEAILFSGNILYDPGFELFVGNAVESYFTEPWVVRTGSRSFVLPRFDISLTTTGQRWPNDDQVAIKDIAQWSQYTEPYDIFSPFRPGESQNIRESSAWQVIRRESPPSWHDLDFSSPRGPKLGKWMARWYDWQSSDNFPFGNAVPGGLLIQGPGMPAGYSGRTQPGALITWGFHAWLSGGSVTTDETLDLCIQFYKKDGTPIFSTSNSHSLTTSKTEYILSSNSPGGSYFMRACCSFRGTGTRAMMLQVDTGRLGVER